VLVLNIDTESFSAKIIYAIFQAKIIEERYRKSALFRKSPLWADYLVHSVLRERPGTHPVLDVIREIAEKLALGEICIGINSSFHEYVRELCKLAVRSSRQFPISFLIHIDEARYYNMSQFQLDYLTAAATFNKPHVVKTLLTADWVSRPSNLFGSPYEHAASNGNYEVLEILFAVLL
jgi:hypothetical protein